MGSACCVDQHSRELADKMLEDELNKTVEPPSESSFLIKDEFTSREETPVQKLSAMEKQKRIKEAANLLTTILFNPTRKGINCLLTGLTREEKARLFRNFVSNFPDQWNQKFDKVEFDDWRLEKLER